MATLRFSFGTMGSGKSTMALQIHHNLASRELFGYLLTKLDREGAQVTSRLGVAAEAVEVLPDLDLYQFAVARWPIHYLVCDEAQFYTPEQVEQLARLVDELGIDVFAFGITSDFRTRLFPGSARLLELADRVNVLQVEALCWCGARATHNARTVDGVMVVEGDQMVVGDVDQPGDRDAGPETALPQSPGRLPVVGYETLCRRHHMRRQTSRTSPSLFSNEVPLPFEEKPGRHSLSGGARLQGAEPGAGG